MKEPKKIKKKKIPTNSKKILSAARGGCVCEALAGFSGGMIKLPHLHTHNNTRTATHHTTHPKKKDKKKRS